MNSTTSTPANALAHDLSAAAEALQRSTVQVRAGRHGGGSGLIWRSDGLIITNAHVAPGPTAQIELWDGRTFEGAVTAHDRRRDLASISIAAENLATAPIGDSDALRVGEVVVAVGNPLGLTGALTLGIVHAIAPAEGHGHHAWVQADVHLAPGNSGGPLADSQGRVIGINSMTAGELGLAVPSKAVQAFVRTGGVRPHLGVLMQPVTVPVSAGRQVNGMLILEVTPNSAADRAGLIVGDIVTAVGGRPLESAHVLVDVLQGSADSTPLRLDLLRGGVWGQTTITPVSTSAGHSREGAAEAA